MFLPGEKWLLIDDTLSLRDSYDLVAEDYADEYGNELDHKPFDRKLLDWLVEKVDALGPICDLGCGPGHIARYLHTHGAQVRGIDLSPGMVAVARRLNPEIPFEQGDMLALTRVPDGTYGGIAAFHCIIHVPRERVVRALQELRRVLCPRGVLLLTFHIGREVIHRDEWWRKPVCVDFIFYETADMKGFLSDAGFELEEAIERDPYPDVEYPSRRAYLFARNRDDHCPAAQRLEMRRKSRPSKNGRWRSLTNSA